MIPHCEPVNEIASMLEDGNRDFGGLEQNAADRIAAAGLEPDYVAIRDANDLSVPNDGAMHLIVLAAARIEGVRLLDNVLVELPG